MRALFLCVLLLLPLPALAEESATPPALPDVTAAPPMTVKLLGLNKVTGRSEPLEAPTETVMRFGALEIIAHRCWKSPPEDQPENAVLLEISELKSGEPPQRIFLGWMFSSSPGLSGLEHPVYDVTVISCTPEEPAKPAVSAHPAPPPAK